MGHLSGITDTERNLFANAVIAAANVTAVDPEATFLDDFDPVAAQEEYRYYMPDRLKASEAGDTSKYFRWGQYVLYSNPRLQHGRIKLKQYGQ